MIIPPSPEFQFLVKFLSSETENFGNINHLKTEIVTELFDRIFRQKHLFFSVYFSAQH